MSDQHNATCFSYKNHSNAVTPNLDKLANEGVTFGNAYCNNPICTPSRMSFLSSLYPSSHRYYGLYGAQPTDQITNMFSWFKSMDYRTGALGKLHTPRYWIERDCQYVYDEFIEFPKYLEGAGLYEKNDNRKFTGHRDGECSFLPYEHSCESALVKQFKRFIDNEGEPNDRVGTTEPWFSWVSFARPHEPYTPSKEFYDLFDESKLVLSPVSELESDVIKGLRSNFSEERLRKEYHAYLALIAQVDYAIGTMIELLKKRKLLENTIIVYSADHGDYASTHGMMEKENGISYNAITQIPFIIVDPEKGYKGVRNQIVQSIDLFPTLCDLIGVKKPDTLQGESLVPVLEDETTEFRNYALTENYLRKAIATKEYRYISNVEGGDELYDRMDDELELYNLIEEPKYQEVVSAMRKMMIMAVSKANWPITTFEGFWQHTYNQDGKADLMCFKEGSLYS